MSEKKLDRTYKTAVITGATSSRTLIKQQPDVMITDGLIAIATCIKIS